MLGVPPKHCSWGPEIPIDSSPYRLVVQFQGLRMNCFLFHTIQKIIQIDKTVLSESMVLGTELVLTTYKAHIYYLCTHGWPINA